MINKEFENRISNEDVNDIVTKNIDGLQIDCNKYIYIKNSIDFIYNSFADAYKLGFSRNALDDSMEELTLTDRHRLVTDKCKEYKDADVEIVFDCCINLQDIDDKGENFVVPRRDLERGIREAYKGGSSIANELNKGFPKRGSDDTVFDHTFKGSKLVLLDTLKSDRDATLRAGAKGKIVAIGGVEDNQRLFVEWDEENGDEDIQSVIVNSDDFGVLESLQKKNSIYKEEGKTETKKFSSFKM